MIPNHKRYLFAVANVLQSVSFTHVAVAADIRDSVLSATHQTAAPEGATSAVASDDIETPVYVDIILNQMPVKQLAKLSEIRQHFYISGELLAELGIVLPSSQPERVSLADLPAHHIQYRYDASTLQLALTVPVELLTGKTQTFSLQPASKTVLNSPTTALLMNYNAYATNLQNHPESSVWHEMRMSGIPYSTFSNTMQMQNGATGNSSHRLDTTWSYARPDSMFTIQSGDILTASMDWSRSVRLGGIRLASDLSLQPYNPTTPLASFVGNATLPSQVELYIDGIKQVSQRVSPGQFQLQDVPVVSGAGQATMNITDITGQTQSVAFNVYGAPALLKKGLLDWSIELGVVREAWGLSSFDYASQPVISMSTRYGLSDVWTLEFHSEGERQLYNTGAGTLNLLPFSLGVINMAWSHSQNGVSFRTTDNSAHCGKDDERSTPGRGNQKLLGYSWNNKQFTLSASATRRSQEFRDVVSRYSSDLASAQEQVFMGVNTPVGQVSSGYIQQKNSDDVLSRYLSLNWSKQTANWGSFYLSMNRQLDTDNGITVNFSWSLPLNDRTAINSSHTQSKDRQNSAVSIAKNTSRLGDPGWRLQAGGDQLRHYNLQGEWRYMNHYGDFGMGAGYWLNDSGMATTSYASANGAVLLMDSHLFAMRSATDAFALVSTNGIPDVPVTLENRLIGHTGESGYFLINDLNAYQHNQVGIDSLSLPLDLYIGETSFDVVPQRASANRVFFDIQAQRSLQLALKKNDGLVVPAGSAVWITPHANQDERKVTQEPELTQVGFDGVVYLSHVQADSILIVALPSGERCHVHVTASMLKQLHHIAQEAQCNR